MTPAVCACGPIAAAIVQPTARDVEALEAELLHMEQVDCPLTHQFTDGAYLRTIRMAAGLLVIGQKHKTRHFNIVLRGSAMVMMDGVVKRIDGPCIFESEPGVRKVLFMLSDVEWATLHVTPETDLEKLENLLIEKSDAFLHYQLQADAAKLRELIDAAPSNNANS